MIFDDNKIRVIICDDHELARMGITGMLLKSTSMSVTGSAGSAEELIQMLPSIEADVILLDVMMPGMNGVMASSIIKRDYPSKKILILSSDVSQKTIENALEAGVDGFVSKNATSSELIRAVESVSAGLHYYGKDVALLIRDISAAESKRIGTTTFTSREKEIITLCCEGFICKEISSKLNISLRTVENHKANIFKKLGINTSVELIRYGVKHGLIDFQ